MSESNGNGQHRKDIRPGLEVDIVLKKDQPTGKLTHGIVKEIFTSAAVHTQGIKVRLQNGQVGRVQRIYSGTTARAEKKSPVIEEEEDDDDDFDNFI